MNHAVLVYTNGDFERAYAFETKAEARAFADGCGEGAGHFGGDGLFTIILPIRNAFDLEEWKEAVPNNAERVFGNKAADLAMHSGRCIDRGEASRV